MGARDVDEDVERRVRLSAFSFLEAQTSRRGEVLDWSVLTGGFTVNERSVPLLGASGIWKPEVLSLPISLTTAPPRDGKPPPYEDGVGSDGLLRYRYQGSDPANHFNAGLREVFRRQLPLIYFLGVDPGRYTAFWPCFVVEDHPELLAVSVALNDAASVGIDLAEVGDEPALDRAYARRLTLQRLHQAGFRERVLRAYRKCCAVCRLGHSQLLDAAHIIADRNPLGAPEISNGMALCKIHHAAFDGHILGIRPDYVVEIRADILLEHDGPMLKHGLQELHGSTISVPNRVVDRPGERLLEIRYDEFRRAS